jgi:L-malate glycosyltransferase
MSAPWPVLLVAQELSQGGSERQLAETAKALDRRRFTPHVAVFRAGGMRYEELERLGIPLAVFPFRSFWHWSIVRAGAQFRHYCHAHGIALVHPFDTPGALFAIPAAQAAGVPVVLSSQRTHRELLPALTRRLLRATDRMAAGVVVNCQMLARHLAEDEGVPPAKIQVCYNGLDTARFPPAPRQRRQELPPGAGLVIGVVCALRPEKDLPTLLEAFVLLQRERPDAHLVFVGNGEAVRTQLERRVNEAGLGAAVLFFPATAEVDSWLRSIDIFVLPSRSEALSNSLMEAMSCGCAVVASRAGGNVELVEHGQRGLLFPPGDAAALAAQLRLLADDPAMRKRLADAGSAFIHDGFTLPAAAGRMEEIYTGYLTGQARSAG